MPQPSVKTAETDTLRIFMISRGISVEKLAAKCGVKIITIRDAISQNFPTRHLRLVVETALKICIWSDPVEFQERQALAARCGFDPFLLSVPEIKEKLGTLKIRGRSKPRRKAQLIDFLRSQFPPPTTPTNEYQKH